MSQPVSLPTAQTLDVAIIGAGLCGLALARVLTARGLRVQVLEARARLGGRVLTAHCDVTDQAVDLGPTWFWPETEPRMAALLLELGLPSLAQHDPGDVLWLTDPNRAPERSETAGGVHAGARRILGGIARLIEALEATLPTECVRTHMPVSGLRDCGSSIEISVQGGTVVHARQVVLAMPPRLVREHIQFEPALPDTVLQALEDSPTWMAAQAKALVTFAQPFWRAAGHSGNAFVRHPQAVLAEVFDCSSDAGAGAQAAALGGFVALNAAQRDQFRRSLPLLIESQLVQLYGVQAQSGNLHLQDWALERWTSSTTDRAKPPQPPQSQPLLRRSLWAERLFFGGSETAAHGVGHMEGALESADRIAHALARAQRGGAALRSAVVSENPRNSARQSAMSTVENVIDERIARAASIGAFSAIVLKLRALAPKRYTLHLARLLIAQQNEQLTQRALLATVDQCYSEALAGLDPLLPNMATAHAEVVDGRHPLGAALLAPFEGWNKELLNAALSHNASSCALSNFVQDHRPDADTLHAITLDLAAAWREFAIELNTRLLVASDVAATA